MTTMEIANTQMQDTWGQAIAVIGGNTDRIRKTSQIYFVKAHFKMFSVQVRSADYTEFR